MFDVVVTKRVGEHAVSAMVTHMQAPGGRWTGDVHATIDKGEWTAIDGDIMVVRQPNKDSIGSTRLTVYRYVAANKLWEFESLAGSLLLDWQAQGIFALCMVLARSMRYTGTVYARAARSEVCVD